MGSQLALGSAALLLAEVALADRVTWFCSDLESGVAVPVVLAAAAVGKIVAVHPRVATMSRALSLICTAGLVVVAGLGLANAASLGLLWMALPIVGFGIFLSRAYAELPLRLVVWGLGVGAVLCMVSLLALYSLLGAWMLFFAALLSVLAALLETRAPAILGIAIVIIATGVAVESLGLTDGKTYVERHTTAFRGARQVAPTEIGPLLRTDLIHANRPPVRYLITNGSRHAYVVTSSSLRSAGRRVLTTDAPYILFGEAPQSVLVVGAGGGKNVAAAVRAEGKHIVALDVNPQVFTWMQGLLSPYTAGLYNREDVETITAEGRYYLETTPRTFDVISIQGVQSGTVAGGVVVEAHLFTREALQAAWRRLEPGGVLFYDDYRRDRDRSSLVETLAVMAKESLHLSEEQMLFYRYSIRSVIRADRRLRREGLVLSRSALSDEDRRSFESVLSRFGGSVIEEPRAERLITDDRPFYLERADADTIEAFDEHGAYILVALLVVLAFGTMRLRPKGATQSAIFWLGAAFILVVQGVGGVARLLLGAPELSRPLIFGAIYLGTLVGGVAALRARSSQVRMATWTACVTVFVVALVGQHLDGILSLESIPIRSLLLMAWIVPLAMWTEVPYVAILRRVQGRHRALHYAWGAGGALVGVVAGLYLQVALGFSFVLMTAGLIYAAVALSRASRLT